MASEPDQLRRVLSLAVHELRTPLGVAAGYLRLLLREQTGTLADTQRTMLEGAASACKRIGALIDQMSELQRLEAGDVIVPHLPFDLATLITEVSGRMFEGHDRGVRLQVIAEGPLMVTGDRPRLADALSALIHATLRERSEPGVIVIECFATPDAAPTWAIVTIGDEAIGRSPVGTAGATLPPFEEWRGGLGLALPVGRRVIEAHGGAVWSAPGGPPGAGSGLRLPLATPGV